MALTFKKIDQSESKDVIHWLSSETWPYHVRETPDPDEIGDEVRRQLADNDEFQYFWIMENDDKVGMIKINDLTDPAPMFDLRIRTIYRRHGYGKEALDWMTHYIFDSMPDKQRIEGQTRRDNMGMRTVFHRCGYVKEAHYRKAWPSKDGKYYDSIGYGIIREDWKNKKTTPVDWDDEQVFEIRQMGNSRRQS